MITDASVECTLRVEIRKRNLKKKKVCTEGASSSSAGFILLIKISI